MSDNRQINHLWDPNVRLLPGRWYVIDFGDGDIAIGQMDGWSETQTPQFSILLEGRVSPLGTEGSRRSASVLGEIFDPLALPDSAPRPD